VRTATVLVSVLLAGTSAGLMAQGKATAPETFTATAQAKNATGGASGTLEVRVSRYTPDFDRKTVEEALRLGGYPRFLPALRNAPEVGQLVLAGGPAYTIRYAREKVDDDVRTIVLVTDRPVLFIGGGRAESKPRAGYEIALVQIVVPKTGPASGTMAAAARVRPDGTGGVVLDDYAEDPITLTNIARRAQ